MDPWSTIATFNDLHGTACKLGAIVLFFTLFMGQCEGHGRLIEPPSRSSAWRYGFKTPVNYNDNELFCGGYNVQWNLNGGKCGVCGDNWNGPRNNELPDGKYARGLQITRVYDEGQIITVRAELTANHRGYFQYKLCPAVSDQVEVTQECLDQHVLEVVSGGYKPGDTYIPITTGRRGIWEAKVRLPKGLTCHRCVIQWTYTAGNNWGRCSDGLHYAVGCGPQETFRGCADVQIRETNSIDDPGRRPSSSAPTKAPPKSPPVTKSGFTKAASTPTPRPSYTKATIGTLRTTAKTTPTPRRTVTSVTRPTPKRDEMEREGPPMEPSSTVKPVMRSTRRRPIYTPPRSTPRWMYIPKTGRPTPKTPKPRKWPPHNVPGGAGSPDFNAVSCVSDGRYKGMPGMDRWCQMNCGGGYCPSTHCSCN